MKNFLDPYEAIDNLKAEIIILNELSFQNESNIEYQEFLQFFEETIQFCFQIYPVRKGNRKVKHRNDEHEKNKHRKVKHEKKKEIMNRYKLIYVN